MMLYVPCPSKPELLDDLDMLPPLPEAPLAPERSEGTSIRRKRKKFEQEELLADFLKPLGRSVDRLKRFRIELRG